MTSTVNQRINQIVSFLISLIFLLSNGICLPTNAITGNAGTSIHYGDLTNDDLICNDDLSTLKQCIFGEQIKSSISTKAGDVDGNKSINVYDVIQMKQILLYQKDSFSIENTIDSDNDGLLDCYEKTISYTNPYKPDSDNDSLSDYNEIYLCGTDPLLLDSNNTGIIDSQKDMDNDGLTNIQEIEYGTNPLYSDSDNDGLFDKDEINKYQTSPITFDTDKDGIGDGDEIKLNLNPNKIQTHDCPDNQYIIEQSISSDSTYLTNINNNPFYGLSLTAKCSGLFEKCLTVQKSKYSDLIKDNSIVGIPVELIYNQNFIIQNTTINFKLKANDDIQNFAIFKYFEDSNMLLPVDTSYDIANNSIYTNTEELGTYCLVNLNIWTSNIGVPSTKSNLKASDSSITDDIIKRIPIKPVEIAFLLDCSSQMSDTDLYNTIQSILSSSKQIFADCPQAKICVQLYHGNNRTYLSSNYDNRFATNFNMLQNMFLKDTFDNIRNDTPTISLIDWAFLSLCSNEDYYKITEYTTNQPIFDSYVSDSKRFVFLCPGFQWDIFYNYNTYVEPLKKNNINLNIIYPMDSSHCVELTNFAQSISSTSIAINQSQLNSNIIADHIYNNTPKEYTILSCNNESSLGSITLNKPITEDWYKAYLGQITDLSDFEDTDGDGLYDFQEIGFNTNLIKFNADGSVQLPSFSDCCNYYESAKKGYDEIISNYFKNNSLQQTYLNSLSTVPIISNPNKIDTDDDKMSDFYDKEPSTANDNIPDLFKTYINDGTIPFNSIITSNNNISICSVSLSQLPLVSGLETLYTCDEYGNINETCNTSITFDKESLNHYYLMCHKEGNDFKYNVVYTLNGEDLSKIGQDQGIFTALHQIFDETVLPYQTLYYNTQKNGLWDTVKYSSQGAIAATLNHTASALDMIRDATIQFHYGDDFSWNRPSERIFQSDYQALEKKWFDTENQVYKASMTISSNAYMALDTKVMMQGMIITIHGITLGVSDAVITTMTIPATGGASVIITLPVAVAATAEVGIGAAVTASGAIMLASDANAYTNALNELNTGVKKISSSTFTETDKYVQFTNNNGQKIRINKQPSNTISQSIDAKLKSTNDGTRTEAIVADYIRKNTSQTITDFGNKVKNMGSNQVIGDIDVTTNNYIIEVKKSISSLDIKQFDKYLNINDKDFFNIKNKKVVLYIHEKIATSSSKIENLKERGVIVVNSLEELGGILS